MAAVYYTLQSNSPVQLASGNVSVGKAVFGKGFPVNTAIRVPFLDNLTTQNGFCIITEIGMQNKETMQYFLTFDDIISYFHFGKGLGSANINGLLFSDCNDSYTGINIFNQTIANLRGTTQAIIFGSRYFWCILSNFTIRASAEEGMQNCMEFSLQMEIINHDYYTSHNYPSC